MVGKIILNYLIITTVVYIISYIYRDRKLDRYIGKKYDSGELTYVDLDNNKLDTESPDIEKVFNKKFVKYLMAWSLIMLITCPLQELLMCAYEQIRLKMTFGSRNVKDFNNALKNNTHKIVDDIVENDEKIFLDVDMSGNEIMQ
jgi:hypothetical protein